MKERTLNDYLKFQKFLENLDFKILQQTFPGHTFDRSLFKLAITPVFKGKRLSNLVANFEKGETFKIIISYNGKNIGLYGSWNWVKHWNFSEFKSSLKSHRLFVNNQYQKAKDNANLEWIIMSPDSDNRLKVKLTKGVLKGSFKEIPIINPEVIFDPESGGKKKLTITVDSILSQENPFVVEYYKAGIYGVK